MTSRGLSSREEKELGRLFPTFSIAPTKKASRCLLHKGEPWGSRISPATPQPMQPMTAPKDLRLLPARY